VQQGARRRIWAPFRHNWRILVLSISPSERYVGRWRGHSTTSPCSLACLTQTVRDPDAKREIVRCSTGALHPGQTSGTSSRTAAPATRSASPGPPGPAHLAYLARRSCRPSDRAAPSARAAFTYEDTSDECPEAVANFQYKDGYVWRSPEKPCDANECYRTYGSDQEECMNHVAWLIDNCAKSCADISFKSLPGALCEDYLLCVNNHLSCPGGTPVEIEEVDGWGREVGKHCADGSNPTLDLTCPINPAVSP